ncbi:hypothetical protein DFJ73DRAFT_957126 [Zopfochytrium polystomum]|nr:hypothetical protein DFJ73DRAFT_957126 [Zopfochytrium polystomum]
MVLVSRTATATTAAAAIRSAASQPLLRRPLAAATAAVAAAHYPHPQLHHPCSFFSSSAFNASSNSRITTTTTTTTTSSAAKANAFTAARGRFLASSSAKSDIVLTSDRNPHLKRNPSFASIEQRDIDAFRSILSAGSLLTDPDDVAPFNEDWQRKFRGAASVVLKPKTTQEVAAILKYCNERGIAVVPQGGNTGLVGGSVPVFDEVVLSTSSMNSIQSFDEVSGILTCQAGCVLEVLDKWLGEKGFMMPLDLGAKGSCQIGGNVSTNAGGLRLIRYGSLHGTVLSMEVVTADGRILQLGQPLRKDNTGFDLKHLFIGGEGTLGVVSSVSILAPRRPTSVNVAVLATDSFPSVLKVFSQAKTELNEILSAFEFWDGSASDLVFKHHASARDPFSSPGELRQTHPFYVLIETAGSNKDHDSEKLGAFLERLLDGGLVATGALAESEAQQAAMWSLRESITEACSKDGRGGNLKYDVSMPVSVLYECVEAIRGRLAEKGLYGPGSGREGVVVGFGHMGDGNLHLNVTGAAWDDRVLAEVEPYLYELVKERNGSISAEHGLGLAKAPYIGYSKSEECVQAMKALKALWDPKGILNPYKFLPQ